MKKLSKIVKTEQGGKHSIRYTRGENKQKEVVDLAGGFTLSENNMFYFKV